MSTLATKQAPSPLTAPTTSPSAPVDRGLCATVLILIALILGGVGVGLYFLLKFELNKSSSAVVTPPYVSSSSSTGTVLVSSSPFSSTGLSPSAVVASNNVPLTTGSTVWSVNQVGSFVVNNYVQITWTGNANDYTLAVITAVNSGSLTITANSLTVSPTNSGLGINWTPWVITLISNTPPPSISSSSSPIPSSSSSSSAPPFVSSSTSSVAPPPPGTIVTSGNMPLQSNVIETVSGVTATVLTGTGGGLAFASFPPRGNAWAGNAETWLEVSGAATLSSNYTYSVWVLMATFSTMGFVTSAAATNDQSFWSVFEPPGSWQFGFGSNTADSLAVYTVPTPPAQQGSWFHLTFTFNAVTGLSVVYLNGSSVYSTDTGPQTSWTGGSTVYVGATMPSFVFPIDGAMQCLHWSPNELNNAQISAVYQAELGGVCCLSYQACITSQIMPTSGSMNLQSNLIDSKAAASGSVVTGTLAFSTVAGRGPAWTSTATTYLQMAQASDPLSTSYSVMFWVNVNQFMGGLPTILVSTPVLNTPSSFSILLTTSYGFQFGHGNGGFGTPFATTNLGSGILGTWFHAAVTYSATTGVSTIYINGASAVSNTVAPSITWTGGSILQIGTGVNSVSYPLYGSMNCLHWDNVALAAGSISTIFASEGGGVCVTTGF